MKKLDRKAKMPAEIFAYTFGIFIALVFGTGMCLAMQVIGPTTVPLEEKDFPFITVKEICSYACPHHKALAIGGQLSYNGAISL